MKKVLFLLIFLTTITNCKKAKQKISLNEIFNRKFEHSFISKGNNFPDFSIRKRNRKLFLVALHSNISVKDFQAKAKISDKEIKSMIQLLASKKWLHKINEMYKPTVFVATKEDGKELYKYSKPIAKSIALKIKDLLPKIKEKFSKTEISKKQSFNEWSFLILSNVLLDSWQIFNIENQFLGKYTRPERHGKNYYAAIEETTTNREAFGIYGNQHGKKSVYGNNREKADLSQTNYFISKKDNIIFKEMAQAFLPELIKILNNKKQYSKEVYENLGYSKEITFEEFYIWWYHFIYSQATEYMNEMNILSIPTDGNFVYKIEQ